MRRNANSPGSNLHWHEGGTCHGAPSLQACTDQAIKRGWSGKVLEKTDVLDSTAVEVKCYSLISSSFDHWTQHGRFVAEVRQEWVVVPLEETR